MEVIKLVMVNGEELFINKNDFDNRTDTYEGILKQLLNDDKYCLVVSKTGIKTYLLKDKIMFFQVGEVEDDEN